MKKPLFESHENLLPPPLYHHGDTVTLKDTNLHGEREFAIGESEYRNYRGWWYSDGRIAWPEHLLKLK